MSNHSIPFSVTGESTPTSTKAGIIVGSVVGAFTLLVVGGLLISAILTCRRKRQDIRERALLAEDIIATRTRSRDEKEEFIHPPITITPYGYQYTRTDPWSSEDDEGGLEEVSLYVPPTRKSDSVHSCYSSMPQNKLPLMSEAQRATVIASQLNLLAKIDSKNPR
jgi:hypothetical protein